MIIAVGCDHGGFPLKQTVIDTVKAAGHETVDLGTFSAEAVDYPDFSKAVANTVQKKKADRGIIICGSGVGATVAANKFKGIRAGLCHDTFSARQGVEDDDMNMLCLGSRVIGSELAREVLKAFLAAKFSGLERHQRRLNKVLEIEAAGK